MAEPFLPYGRQLIEADDIAAVTRVLQSDFLTAGPEIPAFEAEFADAVGGGVEAVACQSGTAALHLAMDALGLGHGEIVIVPSVTFLATANAARYCGGEVVFADVDPETGLVTPQTLKAALEDARKRFGETRIAGIAPVHLAGVACDLEALYAIAREEGAWLIADSCHALGTRWRDSEGGVHQIGGPACCDAATFSFHPVKTIACGEGGMVTVSQPGLADAMRRTRSHNIERDPARMEADGVDGQPWYYEMARPGWNYRLPDLAAALGRSQLAKLDRFCAARRRLCERYEEVLEGIAHVRPPAGREGVDPCRHLMNVRIDFEAAGVERGELMARLHAAGVGTQVHYIPVHTQPYYARRYGRQDLPGTQRYYRQTLSLPLFPGMEEDDVARVGAALKEALSGR